MDDAEAVRLCERVTGFDDDVAGLLDAEGPALGKELRHALAAQQLHEEVARAIPELAHVHDGTDVRARDARRRARLLDEARVEPFSLRDVVEQGLQGEVLVQAEVNHLVHGAHPTPADDAHDGELPVELLAYLEAAHPLRGRATRTCPGPRAGTSGKARGPCSPGRGR